MIYWLCEKLKNYKEILEKLTKEELASEIIRETKIYEEESGLLEEDKI